jgi:hypothetical protein
VLVFCGILAVEDTVVRQDLLSQRFESVFAELLRNQSHQRFKIPQSLHYFACVGFDRIDILTLRGPIPKIFRFEHDL